MEKNKLQEYMAIPREVTRYAITEAAESQTKYCKWLSTIDDELVIRTFAFRLKKKLYALMLTEIERIAVGDEYGVRKNVYFTQMSGYRVVFEPKNVNSRNWYGYAYSYFSEYDFDVWGTEKALPYYYGAILNIDFLYTIPKYKYCGYSGQQSLKEYLDYYVKDSAVEFFGKAGLKYSIQLGRYAKKNAAFRKFIIANAKEVNEHGFQKSKYAFEHHCSFKEADKYYRLKNEAIQAFKELAKVNYDIDKMKIKYWWNTRLDTNDGSIDRSYIQGCWHGGYQRTYGWHSYRDYWNACVELGLDMRDTKNSMPRDFVTMHDLRIRELASKKAKLDEEKKQAMDKRIAEVADRYEITTKSDTYCVVLPKCQKDFEKEGKALHHCVGSMGYDKDVADGKIIIAFIRLVTDPVKSYCTVEYDLKSHQIIQMHTDHNGEPDKTTKIFIRQWAKKIREVQKLEAI